MNSPESSPLKNLHHREGFIELLFPVAIGTGFAEHVASILLHKDYDRTAGHELLLDKLIGEVALSLLCCLFRCWLLR